jgi:HlyD family secretion protein
MKRIVRRALFLLAALAVTVAVIAALVPRPIEADATRVTRGPLRVVVDEEGETRCRTRFVVAAPVSGRLERVRFDEGQSVSAGDVVARIYPTPIDTRQQAEATARVDAARAALGEADATDARARAEFAQAERSRELAERLVEDGLISREQYELAATSERSAAEAVRAAISRVERVKSEVKQAEAALLAARADQSAAPVNVVAPSQGVVFRVFEESERVVPAGALVFELGDPASIEVVVDVLTSDAVAIRPGASVEIGSWGGATTKGVVRLVEPSAFTKVSALGVEEQRVNVRVDVQEAPGALGIGYRVQVKIIVWENERVLKVPTSALARAGNGWTVFAVEAGRARVRRVEVGHRSAAEVEVLSGLAEGQEIVLHPPNDLADGAKVTVAAETP